VASEGTAGDRRIQELERQFRSSGDRRIWLSLQQEKMRRGLPYEITFIEDVEETDPIWDGEEFYQPEAGSLITTLLNNRWWVDTWFDSDGWNDDQNACFGWTTSVFDTLDALIGNPLTCSGDHECARSCHQNRVWDVISGAIEDYDRSQPLRGSPPENLET
jgi:hypothetical protein